MKKILLLLLLATFSIQAQTLQNPTYGNVKLKNNVTDNSATKVVVQSTDGTINTISKSDLVNVVEVNDVPSLPLVGEVGKIYVVKNVNKIYRWNGTFYQELAGTDISGLQAQIDLKENAFSKNTAFNKNFGTTAGTVVEGGTLGSNAYTSTAFAPLNGTGATGTWGINISGSASSATNWGGIPANFVNWEDTPQYLLGSSAGIAHYYNQQYVRNFLGLGSNAYSSAAYQPLLTNPVTGTGTTNYIPKFTASGTVGNSSIFDNGTNVGIGTNNPITKLTIEQSNNNSSVVIRNGVTASHNMIYIGNDSVNNSSFFGSYKADNSNFSTLILQKFGGKVLIPDLSGTGTRQVVADASGNLSATSSPLDSRPYKVYTALLSQSGTNAPTAVVLENTLGGTVVWTRTSMGGYLGTLTGVFTANKTFCTTTIGAYLSGGSNSIGLVINSVDDVFLFTNRGIAGMDAILNNASIEIRVYL